MKAQFDQAMQELRLMEDEWKKVQEAYQHWQNENIRIQAEQKGASNQFESAKLKERRDFRTLYERARTKRVYR